jgi:hypothetical protein
MPKYTIRSALALGLLSVAIYGRSRKGAGLVAEKRTAENSPKDSWELPDVALYRTELENPETTTLEASSFPTESRSFPVDSSERVVPLEPSESCGKTVAHVTDNASGGYSNRVMAPSGSPKVLDLSTNRGSDSHRETEMLCSSVSKSPSQEPFRCSVEVDAFSRQHSRSWACFRHFMDQPDGSGRGTPVPRLRRRIGPRHAFPSPQSQTNISIIARATC